MKHYIFSIIIAAAMSLANAKDGIGQPAWVILTAGQSNTDGRVLNTDLPDYIQRDGYRYCQWSYGSGVHSGDGRFEPFAPRIYNPNKPGRWAYDAVVYYRLEQYLKRPFYVIKESMGGTAIDTLCRSNSNFHWCADDGYLARTAASDKGGRSLLKAFTDNIGACIDSQLAHLPEGYEIKAMLWHQGESDRSQSARYHDNLCEVVANVRRYLVEKTGRAEYARLPFICGTFSADSKQGSREVVDALMRLQEEDPDFHVVDVSDATLQRDQIHFDAAGAELLGNRMYVKMCDVIGIGQQEDSIGQQPTVRVARYFGNRRAAISHTFDDGLLEHYTEVWPRLKRLELKATFCVNGATIDRNEQRLRDGDASRDSLVIQKPRMTWAMIREMSDDGQEMTSHGWAHQNVTKIDGKALRYELEHNDSVIFSHTGHWPTTFFYPGNAKNAEKVAYVERHRVASRTEQVSFGSKRDAQWSDKWVSGLLADDSWGVTMTHGISYGYDAFRDTTILWRHLERVAAMQDSLWNATFHDVAAYVKERDALHFTLRHEADSTIILPTLPLISTLFRHPLTLIVPSATKSATQGNRSLPVYEHLGQRCIDIDPWGGAIVIKEF